MMTCWFVVLMIDPFGSDQVNHCSESPDPLILVTNHQLVMLFKLARLYVSL